MVGGNIIKTKVPIPGKNVINTTTSTAKYRPSGWAPLAYPLSAFQIPKKSEFEYSSAYSEDSNSTLHPHDRGNVNPYFPLHKHILFVLIRDLMVVDGVLDPKTFELIHAKNGKNSNFSRHWNPDWRKIRKENEEDLDLKRPISNSNSNDHRSKRIKTSQDRRIEARNPSSQTLLGECKQSPHFVSKIKKEAKKESGSSKNSGECNKKSTRDQEEKGSSDTRDNIATPPELTCKPDDVPSMPIFPSTPKKEFDPNQEVIVVEYSESENDNLPSHAEELAAIIAKRAIMSDKTKDVCEYIIPDFISSALEGPQQNRSRTVSDADILTSQNELKVTVSENGMFPCVQYASKEELLHISIYHEEHLRISGYEMVKQALESFSTYALRKLLSYRSTSIARDKMIHLIAALIFNASHAMYAWQQTERELLSKTREEWLSVSMKRSRREELDNRIRRLLFDERDLRKIGGFESSSILPSALLLSRLSERKMSWGRFAKTGLGRKLLKERGGGGSNYKVSAGWVGAWRKMKYASLDGGIKHIKVEPDSSDYEAKEFSSSYSYNDSMSSLVSLHLSRPNNEESWGVKLAREGEMCVVMKVSVKSKDFELKQGDIIIDVQNDQGEHICAPYFSKRSRFDQDFFDLSTPTPREEDRDLRKWFKQVVGIFKSSSKLDLKVTRVGSVHVPVKVE